MQMLPSLQTVEAAGLWEGLFGLAYWLASAQSPQLASDLVWKEFGLYWDIFLASGNIQVLMSNPHAVSLANVIDQNPLYHTLAGWLMANAEMGLLLVG